MRWACDGVAGRVAARRAAIDVGSGLLLLALAAGMLAAYGYFTLQ